MDCGGGEAGADLTWTWQGIVFYFNLLAIHQRFLSKQVNDTHTKCGEAKNKTA